ncbi:MAG: Smr/MutS family protein [Cyanobacteria bacterium REEB67]|nr:Smr/MutS family protein [Cyanobacteria bacterium REEB67]
MSIEDRSLRSLEWERLLVFLAEEAESSAGQNLALSLRPESGRALVQLLLDESEEALLLEQNAQGFALAGLLDVALPLARLGAGSTLAASELFAVKEVLKISNRVKSSLALMEGAHFPRLIAYGPRLVSLKEIIKQIEDAVEAAGVKDSASTTLAILRRDRFRLDAAIKEELGKIIQTHSGGKVLQEPLYTMRNGRFVLPVVASMRYALDGIVHDASQSGLTIYVEPLSVMELSNKARIKDSEIEREVERILTALSDMLRPNTAAAADAFRALAELDLIFAKARLAIKYGGIKPLLSDDHSFNLIAARHPLLTLQNNRLSPPRPVIPSDVSLSGPAYTLVITGPNTGGKTVLLKLIGLTALMVRAGLLIPARAGSKVALFDRVCADIGDEQSLEQSLSTFSAHMKNIVDIVDNAGPGMLVLLDEVGAGTDPVEGAALARAVLEYLKDCQAVTIATTHLGELKTIAFMDEAFINGSFEFDEATLSPTYKLRLGVPGNSKAATIAARLGLKSELVARARALVDVSAGELEEVVARLDQRLAELALEKENYVRENEKLSEWQEVLSRREDELVFEREKIRKQYSAELEAQVKTTEAELKGLIAALQRQPQMAKAQKAREELEVIKKELGWLKPQVRPANRGRGAAPVAGPGGSGSAGAAGQSLLDQLQVGSSVLLRSLNKIGTVQEVIKNAAGQINQIVVSMGSMKIKVRPAEIEPISGKVKKSMLHEESKRSRRLALEKSSSLDTPNYKDGISLTGERKMERHTYVRSQANTLDLRGKRVEEALSLLEQFVDGCATNRITPFMVIHGHGTGAVKSAVRDYLGSMQYEGQYRPGENYEGGDGVTVVDLAS